MVVDTASERACKSQQMVLELLLADLPANVDPCGENGEFHTFVHNAPFFSAPVSIVTGEVVHKTYTPAATDDSSWSTGFYFLDVRPGL